jgi:hypothetical protein
MLYSRSLQVGVSVVWTEFRQLVVDVSVDALIRTHSEDKVSHGGVVSKAPVLLTDLRARKCLPFLHGWRAGIDVIDAVSVRLHSLFFEVTYELVAKPGARKVRSEVEVEKDALQRRGTRGKQDSGEQLAKRRERWSSFPGVGALSLLTCVKMTADRKRMPGFLS